MHCMTAKLLEWYIDHGAVRIVNLLNHLAVFLFNHTAFELQSWCEITYFRLYYKFVKIIIEIYNYHASSG